MPIKTILFLLLFFPSIILAHSPIITKNNQVMTKSNPFVISKPEHSKAIFSELNGSEHYYKIESDIPFNFYAGITVPKLETCDQQNYFSFKILGADFKEIDGRDGASFDWWAWYEKYGKSWYWVGPEIGENFASNRTYNPGTYYVKVFNQTNTGKYALAVGDIEKFGLASIPKLLLTVRKLKKVFWAESNCR